MERNDWTKLQEDSKIWFTINPYTGEFKTVAGITNTFTVIETGDSKNSFKAYRVLQGPVSAVLETISILTWSNNEFKYSDHDEVQSGLCKLVIE